MSGLDPAVFGLRVRGLDAEEHDDVPARTDNLEGAAHGSHEGMIVGDRVVRRKDGEGRVADQIRQPQQGVQDAGARPPVVRLLHQSSGAELGDQMTVVGLVRPADDDEMSAARDEELHAASRALEQRFAGEDGTELLGTRVADDPGGQGAETGSVATSQDERPRGRGGYGDDPTPGVVISATLRGPDRGLSTVRFAASDAGRPCSRRGPRRPIHRFSTAAHGGWTDRRFCEVRPRDRIRPCTFRDVDNCGDVENPGGFRPLVEAGIPRTYARWTRGASPCQNGHARRAHVAWRPHKRAMAPQARTSVTATPRLLADRDRSWSAVTSRSPSTSARAR